ncbi:hypothetical protein EXS62_01250 [Candidatus Kaiserbacteria bacterium]|nr:hypothetical protein [Candidatus Kaiserbacteria bacterium]
MFLHDQAHTTNTFFDGFKIETILVALVGMVIFLIAAAVADPEVIPAGFAALVAYSPLWLPVALFVSGWKVWMHYIRYAYWFNQQMTLLHIELPPEVEKSPLAMELFLVGLWNNGSETTFLQRIWKGQFRAITTLELVSNEGRISYYIHLRKNWKNFIEARLYGQFPEAHVTEVARDYVDEVGYSPETHDLWATEYSKSDAEALPLRTYVDWELDKNPDKPEITIDPLTNLFEFMTSAGPGEYVWIQIIMKARKEDEWYGFYTGDHFVTDAKKKIKEITEEAIERAKGLTTDEAERKKVGSRGAMLLTGGEKLQVEAIERSLTKQVFDCGFRGMYIVKKGKFDLSKINNLVRLWDPFRNQKGNRLNVTRGMSIFDYPWQDPTGLRRPMIMHKMFFWYKHRSYFYVPYDQVPVCMTTEELASLWHFPNSNVKTPALERVPSRRSAPPPNLPTAPGNVPS